MIKFGLIVRKKRAEDMTFEKKKVVILSRKGQDNYCSVLKNNRNYLNASLIALIPSWQSSQIVAF